MTTEDFLDYALEQVNLLDQIVCRPMMSEYLLYYQGILFGGIYDNRLLVKMVNGNKKYNLPEQLPYDGAKRLMYCVEDLEHQEKLKAIILDTCKDLTAKKSGKK